MELDALRTIDSKDAPSLAPDDRPIDLVHLARTTLGDRSLEREVLQLFDRQAALLIARMGSATPDGVAIIAHTMKGSARGIGAWRVARAAEALEVACGSSEAGGALERLAAAADEARAVIADCQGELIRRFWRRLFPVCPAALSRYSARANRAAFSPSIWLWRKSPTRIQRH